MDATKTEAATPHSSQRVLVAMGLFVFLMLVFRAYTPQWSTSPTQLVSGDKTGYKLDPNRASEAELSQIPGIGPKGAQAIVAYREQHGPFANADQLTAVKGVGPKTVEKMKPYLTDINPEIVELQRKPMSPTPPPTPSRSGKVKPGDAPMDINKATAEDFQRLPGIGPTLAARIVDERKVKAFISVDDLRRVKGIGAKILEAIRAYVVVVPE